MFRRRKDFFFFALLTLFTLPLFAVLTSAESIQCADSNADEFLDFSVIHKIRAVKPFQVSKLMVVHNLKLATIQLVSCVSLDDHYPKLVISKEVPTTIIRC